MRLVTLSFLLLLSSCAFITSYDLEGLNKEDVKSKLGEPILIRTESPNQMWVYRKGECSILVYFDETDIAKYVDTSGSCSSF